MRLPTTALVLAITTSQLACANESRTADAPNLASACYRPSPADPEAEPSECVLVRDVASEGIGLVQCLLESPSTGVEESSVVRTGEAWARGRGAIQELLRDAFEHPPQNEPNAGLPHRLVFVGSPAERRAVGCLGDRELASCGDEFAALWEAVRSQGSACE